MERRGFFKSLLGLVALPFVQLPKVEKVAAIEKPPMPIHLAWNNDAWCYYQMQGTATAATSNFQIVNSALSPSGYAIQRIEWLDSNKVL